LLIRVHDPQLYSIYKGKVLKVEGENALVDIGGQVGVLEGAHDVKAGDEITVCVRRAYFRGTPSLSKDLIFTGKYLRLTTDGRVTFSKFIKDQERRGELYTLAVSSGLEGWGVRWRSSSASAPLSELMREVRELKERAERALDATSKLKAPCKVFEGERLVEIIFTYESKEALDSLRGKVCPTLKGHHYFKSMGGIMGPLVDYAERVLKLGVEKDPLRKGLEELVWEGALERGRLRIVHEVPEGGAIELGMGEIISLDPNEGVIKLKRRISGKGLYDGLKIPKEPGDYSITCLKVGDGRMYHFYYSKDGALKGVYLNISTPVELHLEGTIWYVDLKVDVVKDARRKDVRIIDLEELEALKREGVISEELAEAANELANEGAAILSEEVTPEKLNKLFQFNK